jgi:hypothetical protein
LVATCGGGKETAADETAFVAWLLLEMNSPLAMLRYRPERLTKPDNVLTRKTLRKHVKRKNLLGAIGMNNLLALELRVFKSLRMSDQSDSTVAYSLHD